MNVTNVEKLFLIAVLVKYMKEFILERNTVKVETPFQNTVLSQCLRELIQEGSPMNVSNVGKPFNNTVSSRFVKELILGEDVHGASDAIHSSQTQATYLCPEDVS